MGTSEPLGKPKKVLRITFLGLASQGREGEGKEGRGSSKAPSRFMQQKLELSTGNDEPPGSFNPWNWTRTLPYPLPF